MMRSMYFLMCFMVLSPVFSQAEMADGFRGDGKIYVVLAIILLILTGFFFLLFKLDRKTKRLGSDTQQKKG